MLCMDEQHKAPCFHLGALTKHTVFKCKLVGLLLAAELIHSNLLALEPYHIFLDNQAAIKAPTSVTLRTGQQLAQTIFATLSNLQ